MTTESQKKAIKKYTDKLDEVRFRVPKGELDVFKNHSKKQGESLAAFMRRAAKETIERDLERAK